MTSQQRRDRLFEEPTPRQQRHQSLLYRFVRPILRAHCSLWFGMRVVRQPGAPDTFGGSVVVANHCCLLDSCMVACAIAPTEARFLALAENGEARVYGPVVRALGTIFTGETIGEARFMVHRCKQVLKEGNALVVFPEGNLVPYATELQPFRDGAFRIALGNGAPVVPVALVQHRRACLNRLLRRRPGFDVHVGAPLESPESGSAKQRARSAQERARTAMEDMLDGC